MKPTILPFTDPSITLETAGGKGLSLSRMSAAGFPVPPGFILTTEAYLSFVTANGLQSHILKAVEKTDPTDTAGLDSASQTIAAMFTQGSIPPEVAAEISKAYEPFQDRPVAVRSSATAEDLPEASFAGQQETYLNVRGLDALMEAVKKCWASLWTARAIAYRGKNRIDPASVELAVVVQELVFADAAGVMFTANPVNGHRKEALINAAWGLGEAVVSGAVTPDTLTVEKASGKVKERLTAEKEVMTVRTAQGTEERSTPADRRCKAVLTNRQAAKLAALGQKIEAFYGMPMDIEWALAGGKFVILQARPITALPLDWSDLEPKVMYARSSMAEHLPGPVTPLFSTLGLKIANEETTKMYQVMLGKNHRPVFSGDGMYLEKHGYVYGGILMDASSIWQMVRMTFTQVGPIFRNSVGRWNDARNEFIEAARAWEEKNPAGMSARELLQGAKDVFRAACRYFTLFQACIPAASTSETLFTSFYRKLVKRKSDPEASVFLLGADTRALRAEKSLYDLAAWLKQANPVLARYALKTHTEEILADFQTGRPRADVPAGIWQELHTRFEAHMAEYGRTAYEFDFSIPTPAETPGLQWEAVKAFLEERSGNPHDRQEKARCGREEATTEMQRRLVWPVKGLFNRLLQWAQETGPMREDGIADLGLGHPLIRRFLGELGRRLAAGGAFGSADDIYWITETELGSMLDALEADRNLGGLAGPIDDRKAEWKARLKINPPFVLPEKSGLIKLVAGKDAAQENGRTVLTGVGTSEGIVTAPARVLFGPEDFGRMKAGDVLVAVTTTPAWTPLFTLASAVVTDIGGPLSHSSIVAREFGIPAVMSTRSATRLIRDGQMVAVDGGKGTVILLD
jgi:pyruvate,water dikinase